jgi:hypothetical protein
MFFKGLQGLLTMPVVKYGPPPDTPSIVPLYGVPVSVTPPAPTPGGILSMSTETLLALFAVLLLAILGGYVLFRMLLAGKK